MTPAPTPTLLDTLADRLTKRADLCVGINGAWEDEQLLRDAAAALRARPGVDRWIPIDTAPTDKDVLVWMPGWNCGAEASLIGGEGWYLANNHPTDSWGGQIYPTHWMPLPEPPHES